MSRAFSPLGAARWWRSTVHPDEVKILLIALDDEQGCGIVSLLLALMWLTAFRAGAGSLVGYVLPENRQATGSVVGKF